MSKGKTHAWRCEGMSKLEPIKDLNYPETEKRDCGSLRNVRGCKKKKKLEMIRTRISNPRSPEFKKCQNARHITCGNAAEEVLNLLRIRRTPRRKTRLWNMSKPTRLQRKGYYWFGWKYPILTLPKLRNLNAKNTRAAMRGCLKPCTNQGSPNIPILPCLSSFKLHSLACIQ